MLRPQLLANAYPQVPVCIALCNGGPFGVRPGPAPATGPQRRTQQRLKDLIELGSAKANTQMTSSSALVTAALPTPTTAAADSATPSPWPRQAPNDTLHTLYCAPVSVLPSSSSFFYADNAQVLQPPEKRAGGKIRCGNRRRPNQTKSPEKAPPPEGPIPKQAQTGGQPKRLPAGDDH